MADDIDVKSAAKKTAQGADALFKGSKAFHGLEGYKYIIKIPASSKVNVFQKATATTKKMSVFRLDKAHKGANFNHININPKISGFRDPHIPLPPGSLTVGNGAAKVAKVVNKVALPVAIAIDTVTVGCSVYKDSKNGTTRNTVESAASVAGGWGGGYGGATAGCAIGSAICPGFGTIIGGIIGGIAGGVGGSYGACRAVDSIGDAYDYDIEEVECEKCGGKFKIRKYREKETNNTCSNCDRRYRLL